MPNQEMQTECSACGFKNPSGMRFCGRCGAALPSPCPACGAENPPGFKFCGQCGASLEAPDAAASPEGADPGISLEDMIEIVEEIGPVVEELTAKEVDVTPGVTSPTGRRDQGPIGAVEEPVRAPALEDLIEIVEEEQSAEGELLEGVEKAAGRQPEVQTGEAIEERAPAWLTCTVCGADNPATALHCEVCGAVVAPAGAPCPACGRLNERGSLFCEICGERLGLDELL